MRQQAAPVDGVGRGQEVAALRELRGELRVAEDLLHAGLDNDPEKIGIHMLEMLTKFRNEGIVD